MRYTNRRILYFSLHLIILCRSVRPQLSAKALLISECYKISLFNLLFTISRKVEEKKKSHKQCVFVNNSEPSCSSANISLAINKKSRCR